MWIASEIGFYSIVRKQEDIRDQTLTIRVRVASDLDDLRSKFLPELSPTVATPRQDYEFRARAPQAAVARAIAGLCNELTYNNFKARVAEVQGEARAVTYNLVWAALGRLASEPSPRQDLPIIFASIGDREDISLDPESPSVIARCALRSREASRYSTCGLQRDVRDAYIARLERALRTIATGDWL